MASAAGWSTARFCRLYDAGSSGRDEEIGGSVSWRLREPLTFLIGGRVCVKPQPGAAQLAMKQDSGLELQVFGNRF